MGAGVVSDLVVLYRVPVQLPSNSQVFCYIMIFNTFSEYHKYMCKFKYVKIYTVSDMKSHEIKHECRKE